MVCRAGFGRFASLGFRNGPNARGHARRHRLSHRSPSRTKRRLCPSVSAAIRLKSDTPSTDRGGMEKASRRRCTSCRKWYRPHPSASRTEQTCSRACQRTRLGKLSKRRRKRALLEHREQELARQQVCRERRHQTRKAIATADPPLRSAASRSTLSLQAIATMEVILENWDKKTGRSRSRLLVDLRAVVWEIGKNVGHVGTKEGSSHAPAPKA